MSFQVIQGEELAEEQNYFFDIRCDVGRSQLHLKSQRIHERICDLVTLKAERFERQVPEVVEVFYTAFEITWLPGNERAAKQGVREGKEGRDEIGAIFSHGVKGMEYSSSEVEDCLIKILLVV